MNIRRLARVFLLAPLCTAAVGAQAAAFPDRNILMVVAGSPGGGLDTFGRALERTMLETKLLPTGFVLKNMGGAGGNLAKSYVHQRGGDPHTLYIESNRIYVNKLVGTTTLDHHDLTPIARMITEYLVWVV
ncbi:MAG: hypothetical protein HYV99_01520, partial [Betaproteobacteria bacterium]|nr:hypothetical protein [Betaproteobacteria bacterium]